MKHPPDSALRGCLVGALLLTLSTCGEESLPTGPPLLDGLHVPEVLVERPRIALPPADDANRVLHGWFPWRHEGRVALGASAEGAWLQMVHLAPRKRTLALDLVDVAALDGQVRVTAAGREVGTFSLTDPLEIPLPADLPIGRVRIELTPVGSPPPPLDVLAVAVRPVLPAGSVEQEEGDLVQAGDSRVELVRRVGPGIELAGELLPPDSPEPGQSFRITLSAGDEEGDQDEAPVTRLEWAPGRLERFRGARRFRLPTGLGGLVKVTLEAQGAGPPARWRGLRWIETDDEEPTTDPAREPEADSKAHPVPTPPRPRVVLVYVMDALRADFVGHLGGPEGISPTWDRLAEEGVTFRNHRCVAPSTLPSTRALFSGHAFRLAEEYPLIDRMSLLAERFQNAGYRTGLFSGNAYVSPSYGLDRGFDHVAGEVLYGPDSPGETGGINVNAARVQKAALSWLDSLELEKGSDDRAFLYLHTIHPHNPYAPPPDLAARFTAGIPSSIDGRTDTLFAVRDGERVVAGADVERLRGLYAAAFAYNDRELAKLLAALDQRFDQGEVLVILTSDHGEELLEHDGVLHGYTFYEEMLRIPLTVWWPGRIPPGSFDDPTDTLDLHATLVDLLGVDEVDDPDPGRIEGSSGGRTLWPRILGTDTELPPRLHFAAAPAVRGGLVSATLAEGGAPVAKLVFAARTVLHWGMGQGRGRSRDPEYFFDLAADPGERLNRVGEDGLGERWLRSRLRAWVQAGEALAGTAGPAEEPEIDAETRERLRSLGYLQ